MSVGAREAPNLATVQSIMCDECGRVKGEVNHWFKAAVISSTRENHWLAVSPFDMPNQYADSGIKDYCSQECLTKVFQRFLDIYTLDKPQVVHPPDAIAAMCPHGKLEDVHCDECAKVDDARLTL